MLSPAADLGGGRRPTRGGVVSAFLFTMAMLVKNLTENAFLPLQLYLDRSDIEFSFCHYGLNFLRALVAARATWVQQPAESHWSTDRQPLWVYNVSLSLASHAVLLAWRRARPHAACCLGLISPEANQTPEACLEVSRHITSLLRA